MKDDMTFDRLRDPGKFSFIEGRLASVLSKLATGELGRIMAQHQEDELKENRCITGRQLLWVIHQFYRTRGIAGALFSLEDLQAVTFTSAKHIQKFDSDWTHILSGIPLQAQLCSQ